MDNNKKRRNRKGSISSNTSSVASTGRKFYNKLINNNLNNSIDNDDDDNDDFFNDLEFKPSIEIAKAYKEKTHGYKKYSVFKSHTGNHCFHPNDLNRCCCLCKKILPSSTSSLSKDFGLGIELYFKFLKFVGWLSFILLLIQFPYLLINFYGENYNIIISENILDETILTSKEAQDGYLAATTVGNLKSIMLNITTSSSETNNSTYITENAIILNLPFFCDSIINLFDSNNDILYVDNVNDNLCYISETNLLYFYVFGDIITCIIVLIAISWLKFFEKKDILEYNLKTATLNDYSVEIKVPHHATIDGIKKFAEALSDDRVVDIFLVDNTGPALSNAFKRGKLLKKIHHAKKHIKDIKVYIRDIKKKNKHKKIDMHKLYQQLREAIKFYENLVKQLSHIDKMGLSLTKDINDITNNIVKKKSLFCFITFNTHEGQRVFLNRFPKSYFDKLNARLTWPAEKLKLRQYEGSHNVLVRKGPDPSTIIWENVQYAFSRSKIYRRYGVLLVVSSYIIITAIIFFTFGRTTRAFLNDETTSNLDNNNNNNECINVITNYQNNNKFSNINLLTNGIENENNETLTTCFCRFNENGDNDNNNEEIQFATIIKILNICSSTPGSYIATIVSTILPFLILFVNRMIKRTLAKFVNLMRYRSVNHKQLTVMKMAFRFTFVNTAIIVLIVNINEITIFGTKTPLININGFSAGRFSDFNSLWYIIVGTNIITALLVNLLLPFITPVQDIVTLWFKKRYNKAISQQELNEIYAGPGFYLDLRYGQINLTFFVVLMYSSGMPVLYLVLLITALVTYFIDKHHLLKVTRKPPKFDETLAIYSSSFLNYSVVLHILISIWVYSSPSLFPKNNDTIEQIYSNQEGLSIDEFLFRLSRPHLIPYFVILGLFLLYNFAYQFNNFREFIKTLRLLERVLMNFILHSKHKVENNDNNNKNNDNNNVTNTKSNDDNNLDSSTETANSDDIENNNKNDNKHHKHKHHLLPNHSHINLDGIKHIIHPRAMLESGLSILHLASDKDLSENFTFEELLKNNHNTKGTKLSGLHSYNILGNLFYRYALLASTLNMKNRRRLSSMIGTHISGLTGIGNSGGGSVTGGDVASSIDSNASNILDQIGGNNNNNYNRKKSRRKSRKSTINNDFDSIIGDNVNNVDFLKDDFNVPKFSTLSKTLQNTIFNDSYRKKHKINIKESEIAQGKSTKTIVTEIDDDDDRQEVDQMEMIDQMINKTMSLNSTS